MGHHHILTDAAARPQLPGHAQSGVLATILSSLEPAVAIALACIPLLRPLFGSTTPPKTGSRSEYASSKQSSLYSKKGSRSARRRPGTSTEVVDDNHDSSEVQLQPMEPVQRANVTVAPAKDNRDSQAPPSLKQAIGVERRWELRRD